MKTTFLLTAVQNGAKRIPMGLVVAAAIFLHHNATAFPLTINLGSDSGFAVLAYSQITDAGGASAIIGDVGLSPTTGAAIGLTAGQVNGTIYAVDAGPFVTAPALLTLAKNDLGFAYTDAAGRSPTISYGTTDTALNGLTLGSGVYNFGHAATANLTTTLTLDGQNNPNAVWIFQATSDFIMGSGSKVVLINGADACNVFWEIGSSATLGTDSDFVGTLMALQSITADTGATVDGRLLAENAAVKLDHNTINSICTEMVSAVPESGSTLLLLGFGLATLFASRRRFFSPA
jgi:hypothetical protein